jgi:hypothetical protein
MEIIFPPFEPNKKIAGVYKITINNKWVYIGSSVHLKRRFFHWRLAFLGKRLPHNKNIASIIPTIKNVLFEILETLNNELDVKEREDYFLSEYLKCQYLLNRCSSSTKNNFKRTQEERDKTRKSLTGHVRYKK